MSLHRANSALSQPGDRSTLVWEISRPTVWQRVVSPKFWQPCWGKAKAHGLGVRQASSTTVSSTELDFYEDDDTDSLTQEQVFLRPPLPLSHVDSDVSTTLGSVPVYRPHGGIPPPPTAARRVSNAVSCCSSSVVSRHSRSKADLPSVSEILNQKSVPEKIDYCSFGRRISSIRQDDSFFTSSYSEDVDDDESVVEEEWREDPETNASSTVEYPPPEWMNGWANWSSERESLSTDIDPENENLASKVGSNHRQPSIILFDSTFGTLTSSDPTLFLPTTPWPHLAADTAVFTAGWAAAVWIDSTTEDSSLSLDIYSCVTADSLFYIQLLPGKVLQLTGTAADPQQLQLEPNHPLRVQSVCQGAGDCLVIEDTTTTTTLTSTRHLCLLPVSDVEKTLRGHTQTFRDGEWALSEQCDAVLHLRFALDAILRHC